MRILFAISDSDFVATGNKAWVFAARLQNQLSAELLCYTNEQWVADLGKPIIPTVLSFQSKGITVDQRLTAIDTFIETTRHMVMPHSDLPLWKLLALDDFAGSLLLSGSHPDPSLFPECDIVVMPIQGVDNNTAGGCGMYVWLASAARKRNIPIVGFEVSPLGNKQSMVVLPMDHYCVRQPFSRHVLVSQGKASLEKISLMTLPELYLLQVEQREFGASYVEREAELNSVLNMDRSRFVVLIPHHVAYLWEIRQFFKQLHCVGPNLSVIVRVDPNLVRRQYTEGEMVLKLYHEEMNALPHVLIDHRIGPAFLLQRCDLMLSPLSSNLTQWASEMGVPTIICQQANFQIWANPFTRWDSDPKNIPAIIEEMHPLFRTPVATAIEKVLQ